MRKTKKKTQELRKPSSLTQMSNKITAQQRKAYNTLLYNAQQQLQINPDLVLFEINLSQIKDGMGIMHRSYDFLDKMRELQDIKVVIDILGKEKIEHNKRSLTLIAEFRWNDEERNPEWSVKYQLPETIRERLLHRQYYAVLNLYEISKLSSKYGIALYELAQDYIDVEIPWLSVEKFREILGVEPGEYERIGDLIRRVLNTAQEEVSKKTDLSITSKFKKTGRGQKIQAIKFIVKRKTASELIDDSALVSLLGMLPPAVVEIKMVREAISAHLKKNGLEYVESNIRYTKTHANRNVKKYLLDSLANDWAEELRIKERKSKELAEKTREEAATREAKDTEVIRKQQEEALQRFNSLSQEEKDAIMAVIDEWAQENPIVGRMRYEEQLKRYFEKRNIAEISGNLSQ